MAFIDTVPEGEAEGPLRELYEQSRKRDRRVAGVIRVMSQRPRALADLMRLYGTVAHGPSRLSRAQREMIAVVVSGANRCRY